MSHYTRLGITVIFCSLQLDVRMTVGPFSYGAPFVSPMYYASLNGKVRHHLYTFADQTSSRHFAITMEHVVLTIFKYVRGNCMDMNYYSFGLKYYSNLLPVLSSGVLCFTWLVPQGFPSKQCQEVVSTFSQGLLYLLWDCWQPTVLPTASVACRSSWGSKHTVWAFPLWC